MNKAIKWGLIAIIIYTALTVLGIFLAKASKSILVDADIIEIPALIMAGTFVFISIFFKNSFIHGVNTINFSNTITFTIGGLIWFGIGFLFGWILEKKEGRKEKLRSLGKILMIASCGIFAIITLILFLIFLASGETDPLGIILLLLLMLGIFAPPFTIGLVLWIISKLIKE